MADQLEQILEDQLVARAKADILRQSLAEERRRLEFFKNELERDRQEFMEKLKIWYPPPPPCTCGKLDAIDDKDYKVGITDAENFETNDTDVIMQDLTPPPPKPPKTDSVFVEFEKQLTEEMQLKMQLEVKGSPKPVCPCRGEGNCRTPGPHVHTTYYKTELTIRDVKENHDLNNFVKMTRIQGTVNKETC